MWTHVWREAAGYVGCDLKWFADERCCYVADNRRVLRCADLSSFTCFDLDAYGSPWEQALIVAARRETVARARGDGRADAVCRRGDSGSLAMTVDQMIAELKAAGWTPQTATIWRDPAGALWLGPAGAWRMLKKGFVFSVDFSSRQDIVSRAMKLRVEIEQIFTDCASWNANARKPDEPLIDCDPDGELRRVADQLDRLLAAEAQR
jgi:hypothetical protein